MPQVISGFANCLCEEAAVGHKIDGEVGGDFLSTLSFWFVVFVFKLLSIYLNYVSVSTLTKHAKHHHHQPFVGTKVSAQ